MSPNNPIRRFLRAPLTGPAAWVLNIATSGLYFRKSTHSAVALTVFGTAIIVLLVMLTSAFRRHDPRALGRVTEYACLCFLVESHF